MPTNKTPARRVKKTLEEQASIDREVVKAVVEDAVMEIAADVAAIAASAPPASAEILIAQTPEEEAIFDIARVPYLGPSRIAALAAAGVVTISDLDNTPIETIAAIKGIGLKNAAHIKNWVAAQLAEPSGVDAAPSSSVANAVSFLVEIADDLPPAPPTFSSAPFEGSEDLHVADSTPFDLATSVANAAAQEDLSEIDVALRRLKDNLPKKSLSKSLKRQMEKISVVVSEVPEGRDHLSTYGKKKVARTLDQIAKFLAAVSESEKLSEKKQLAVVEELKELRKRLQKALDD